MTARPAIRPSTVVGEALAAQLEARCTPDGFLPFDRFMDVALYGPEAGYYTRARSPFGPGGDYYTAPRVSPLYARTLAARVATVRAALGTAGRFDLVDLGAGDGSLAAGVVRALAERDAARGVEITVVDRSPARRTAALEGVMTAAQAAGATARSARSLAEAGPVRGFVLAHELLDALPARRLRWDGSAWRELGYRLEGGRLLGAEGPLVAPAGVPPPAAGGADAAGLVVELSPAGAAVVREVADHLAEGLFVVVDYGDEEAPLRAAHPGGTVAGVRRHRPVPAPEETPGESDLSVFVNFTRVRAAASAAGLEEIAFRSQAEALGAWGFAGELDRARRAASTDEDDVRLRLAAKNLLFGFGAFRVLELAAPASVERLRGLSAAS